MLLLVIFTPVWGKRESTAVAQRSINNSSRGERSFKAKSDAASLPAFGVINPYQGLIANTQHD